MAVDTIAMSFVVLPLAIIDVTIGVDKSSFTVGLVIFPPALIHGTVRPYLTTFTLPDILSLDPFSVVFGVVLQLNHSTILDEIFSVVRLLIIIELSELLSDLLNFWIVIVVCYFGIGIVLVDSHVHLRHSYFLPRQETSNRCLHLYDKGKLLHCDSSAKLIVIQSLDVADIVDGLASTAITHF